MMARLTLMYILIAISATSSATTTSAPTTPVPTTLAPTTPVPTTSAPTTPVPTTLAPTTPVPTTPVPTTPVPTTPVPTTLAPTTPVPTTLTPTTTLLTPHIPDTFYYNCTKEGGITIINKENSLANLKINYLNESASSCSNQTTEADGSITISKCNMNTSVTFLLEANNTNTRGILGGWHSKKFQIKCDEVNIQPYLLNVTVSAHFGKAESSESYLMHQVKIERSLDKTVTPNVIAMATKPSPSPISSLKMTIKDGNETLREAYIGQALTVAIQIPDKTTVKPTDCKASGNGRSVSLWKETGCKNDVELFGKKWSKVSGEVTNTMYGFRFVGASTSTTITCTVRVCPDGYSGNECELSTCGSRKRKRDTKLSETVTIQKATSSLAIRDPLMTSRAGRQGYELNTIIGLALVTVVFFNMKFFHG